MSTGRRQDVPGRVANLRSRPAGDIFAPGNVEQARRLTAALSIAAAEQRHGAMIQLAKEAAADRTLAQAVILNLAMAVPEAARLAAAGS